MSPEIVGTLKPPRLSAAPSSPALGQLYYDTSSNTLYWWNGTQWVSAAGTPGPANTYITTVGDGSTTVFTVAHNLGASEVVVSVRENSGDLSYVYPEIRRIDNNSIRVIFDVAPTANAYTVLVTGGLFTGVAGGSLSGTYPNPRINWHIGTTPPSSPVDGDLWIYTGSGFYWTFVYDSSEATYKWKFVGGGPAMVSSAVALEAVSDGTTPHDATSIDAGITLPRAGDYVATYGAIMDAALPEGVGQIYQNIVNATDAPTTLIGINNGVRSNNLSTNSISAKCTIPGPNKVVQTRYWTSSGAGRRGTPYLSIIPVRVS